MAEPIHIAGQFKFSPKGRIETLNEGAPDLTAARVYHVALCPVGFREDNPSFGVPELAWSRIPFNLGNFEESIKRSEPNATLHAIESAQGQIQSQRTVQIEVG